MKNWKILIRPPVGKTAVMTSRDVRSQKFLQNFIRKKILGKVTKFHKNRMKQSKVIKQSVIGGAESPPPTGVGLNSINFEKY